MDPKLDESMDKDHNDEVAFQILFQKQFLIISIDKFRIPHVSYAWMEMFMKEMKLFSVISATYLSINFVME